MLIVFNTEETKKIPQYCVEIEQKDGVRKIVLFGSKQRKKLVDYISRKLSDNYISNLKIKIYEK